MLEYPKRLYRGGKGYTVNNIDEEQEFLGGPAKIIAMTEIAASAKTEEELELEHSEQEKEALEYMVSLGYSKRSAKKILEQEGLEKILEAKEKGKDPQE